VIELIDDAHAAFLPDRRTDVAPRRPKGRVEESIGPGIIGPAAFRLQPFGAQWAMT